MASLKNNCAVLNNGLLMPLLGLGCWQEKPVPGKVEIAVKHALNSGYRHLDTAYRYQNETEVGKGIQNWVDENVNNKREDVFVVTKLSSIGMFKEGIRKFLKLSLQNLNLTYVDLYLIHMPIGMHYKKDDDTMPVTPDGSFDIDLGTDLIAIWKEMEKMVDEGLTKSIGISNFSIKQMRKLLAISRIPPAVNQVEMHVGFQQKELVEFCRATNIVVTAYSPLGSPGRDIMQPIFGITLKSDPILINPIVKLVAANHKVTTAQILIKFLIQQGIVTIPKSIDPDRIKSNGDVFSFTLTNTEMDALKLLDKGEKGRGVDLSKFPGLSDHPECPQ